MRATRSVSGRSTSWRTMALALTVSVAVAVSGRGLGKGERGVDGREAEKRGKDHERAEHDECRF